ncbi:MAG: glycosyltransferase family 39 protein [Anaerolineae bacterium]
MKRVGSRRECVVLAIIVLVAIFFRIFRLDSLPRGMTADEATFALEALAIAEGQQYPLFLRGMSGALPMYAYWIAVLFRFLGTSIQTARVGTALAGIVTVPIFYLLARELFPSTSRGGPWPMIPLLATCFLATSYWHIVYSRLAIEPILVPLFGILILHCLLRALKSGRRIFFVLGGLLLGVAFYSYPAAYFYPFLVCALLAYYARHDVQFLRNHWLDVLLLFAVCCAVAAPLALFAVSHFDTFAGRATWVSILNPEVSGGSPLAALATSFVKTAGMFSFRGDLSLVRNPASRPVLDPLASVWFVVGLFVAVRRCREPSHSVILIWLVVMCVPVMFTAEHIPHFSRTIGALPVTCVLPAIGILSAWQWLKARIAAGRLLTIPAVLILAIPILFATTATYRDYFVVWDTQEDLRQGYDGSFSVAAAVMNHTEVPDSLWILPMTPFVPSGYGGDHFDFLYHGTAPYYAVSLDEETAPNEVSAICVGSSTALVIDWKGYVLEEAYNAMAADPKGLIPFLFNKHGRELHRGSYEAFDVVTYEVPESPTFSIADSFEPLTVNFGHELMLTGMALGGSSLQDTSTPQEVEQRELPSGKSGWVVLRWQALTVPSRNYKVAVYLQDEGGHVAGQTDKLLLSNYLHPTQDWEAGQEEIDYYTLPSWKATAPGRYNVGVTLYDAETLQVVPTLGGGQSYELGMMQIVRPLVAAEVDPEVAIEKDRGELAPGIRLLGYDLPRREVNPGDQLSVALYWQAVEDVSRNYVLAVQLANEQGEVWAEEFDAPAYGSYPTIEWAEGEVLKDWHDVSLPTDMPQGDYQVIVRILEREHSLGEAALGQFQVRGRPRVFSIPHIQHPITATLGEAVRFLGYDLSSNEVKPGETLHLALYWQALRETRISYTVFTHLVDAEERIWGQMDSIPQRGEAPTTSWVKGEVIIDQYEIVVDPEVPAAEYVVAIGLYDASSGQRLPVYDLNGKGQGDRILLEAMLVLVAE